MLKYESLYRLKIENSFILYKLSEYNKFSGGFCEIRKTDRCVDRSFCVCSFLCCVPGGHNEPTGGDTNTTTSSSTTTTTVITMDTNAPVLAIVSPTNGQVVGAEKTISGTVSDESEILAVYVELDGTTNTLSDVTNGNWNIDFSFPVENSYTVNAWAEDVSNNVSTAESVTFNVDYSTPEVFISSPASGILTNGSTVEISGTSSVHSNFNIAEVLVSVNGAAYASAAGTESWTYDAALTEGINTIIAMAISDTDKTNFSSSVTITLDSTPASVSSDQSNGDRVSGNYTVSGTVSDTGSGVASVFVNTDEGSFSAATPGTGTWSYSVSSAAAGRHTNAFYAVDNAGNVSATNEVWFIVVAYPQLTISAPADGASTNSASITVSGTATVDGYSISEVETSLNGAAFTTATGTASWSQDLTLAEGTNTITVQAISSIDTTNSESIRVYVDSTAPTVTLSTIQDPDETGLKRATARGTVSDASGASVYASIDGSSFTSAYIDGGNWDETFTGITGSQTVYYYAVDSFGNTSATNSQGFTVAKYVWNILIYKDGDNDLEEYALDDFAELETVSELTNYEVNVIVLIDRITGYSTAADNWTGTRLYKVDFEGDTQTTAITSTRLSGMGLSASGDSDELNMADPDNISDFVDFVDGTYEADNTFLIIWNHGEGWRDGSSLVIDYFNAQPISSEPSSALEELTAYPMSASLSGETVSRGVCVDSTSADMLYNAEVADALAGKDVEVLGFDACLMGMLENVYEFKDIADYMIASEDTEPADGWDYASWIPDFCSSPMTAGDLVTNIVDTYADYYSSTAGCTLAGYDLSTVDDLFTAFNNFSANMGLALWNSAHINQAKYMKYSFMYSNEYTISVADGGEIHSDVGALADYYGDATLASALSDTVIYEWNQGSGTLSTGNPEATGLSVYYNSMWDTNDDGTIDNFSPASDYFSFIATTPISFCDDGLWDSFLYDLYFFPTCDIWLSNNASVTTNVPASEYSDMCQFFLSNSCDVTIDLTVADNCVDVLYLTDSHGNVLTYSYDGTYGNDTQISTNLSSGWYMTCYWRYATTAVGDSTTTITGDCIY